MSGKPPPPVPPRPSKSVVAEALAKSRQFKSPTRQAPPPPSVTGRNMLILSGIVNIEYQQIFNFFNSQGSDDNRFDRFRF